MILSRRSVLQFASAIITLQVFGRASAQSSANGPMLPVGDCFPSHPLELVREMVTVAHFDLARVKELIDSRPSLAKASWDWGFGDWESALGAASHMGNRPIAEYLISKGARPSIFSAAMLGQLDVVKGFLAGGPGIEKIRGPHSISLLAHARVGGATAKPVYDYLQSMKDADLEPPVELKPEESAALVGTYVFGIGIAQSVEVDANTQMYAKSKMYTVPPQLNWTRKGTMPRPLFHLGDKTFYPGGAPSVRIKFVDEVMTVEDGGVVVTARKRKS